MITRYLHIKSCLTGGIKDFFKRLKDRIKTGSGGNVNGNHETGK